MEIITNMHTNVKELDLKKNRIGKLGCIKLNAQLHNKYTLQVINVEDNNLGDDNVI